MPRPSPPCVTPTSAEGRTWLVDTSVAVPLVLGDHDQHDLVVDGVGSRRLGLAGHAALETYSVITRLPAPLRRTPPVVETMLSRRFPGTVHLASERAAALFGSLAERRLTGGSVYDALVAACAVEHGLTLITADRRAIPTYRALSVEVEILG